MTIEQAALLISALGLGAVLNSVVKAITEKRKLGADTTSILTAAARELVEPLRAELANERVERAAENAEHVARLQQERAERAAEHAEHIAELQREREQAAALTSDLDAALNECRTLRAGLAAAHRELTRLRARLDDAAGP